MKYEQSIYYSNTLIGLEEIEKSVDQLLKYVRYLPEDEIQRLIDCCFYGAQAHKAQKRSSGEPYICHPIKVAEILASEVQFNLPVLQAGILHDVIEDTPVEKAELLKLFGDEVAGLVDGVSKLEKDKNLSPQELQARTFTKLAIAMEADPRVVMIKFADRVHNMQTLGALRREKRHRIANETLDVYVPIAGRLGMSVFKNSLEDLSFKQLYPLRYRLIHSFIDRTHKGRESEFLSIQEKLNHRFQTGDIKASVRKRRRNAFSIYQKIKQHKATKASLENAGLPLIVITETRDECYRVLGIIHELYKPVTGKLKDLIASDKSNGYQSIHTTVLSNKRAINFQIRTKQMHSIAEAGIIAIWRAKNQPKSRHDVHIRRWLVGIKDLISIATNPQEFYDAVKRDLNTAPIEVLTAAYEPMVLPQGSTVIDFAYNIHSSLGNNLSGALVNGVDVPLIQLLQDGQTVEILTSEHVTPCPKWLRHAKTSRARSAIRQCLRNLPADHLAKIGRTDLSNHLKKNKSDYEELDEMLELVATRRSLTLNQLFEKIGLRDIRRTHIHEELQQISRKKIRTTDVFVVVINKAGALSCLTNSIANHRVNILDMKCDGGINAETAKFVFTLVTESNKQLDAIKEDLLKQQYVKTVKIQD